MSWSDFASVLGHELVMQEGGLQQAGDHQALPVTNSSILYNHKLNAEVEQSFYFSVCPLL